MAQTEVARASGLNPTYVQEKVISRFAERENYFAKFTGAGPNSIIQTLTDLAKRPGDTMKITLFSKLSGEGTDSDDTLEGNEEALTPYQDTIYIDQKRHGVRLKGRMTNKRSAINLRAEAGYALGTWGKDWISEVMGAYLFGARGTRSLTILPTSFTGFAGNAIQSPDSTHTLWAGASATEAALAASDKMTVAVLDKARAKVGLLINSGIPMKPVMVNGQPRYVVLVSPEQAFDLWQDQDFIDAQQNAGVRGNENNLFTGALGFWKDMIIHECPVAPLVTNGAGGANYARAIILGAQAGAMAFGGEEGATEGGGGRWRYVEKDFDYGNQTGVAINTLIGVKKLQFNSKDHAVFSINTGYTAI